MRKTFTLTILSILLSSSFLFAQSIVTRYCEVITVVKTPTNNKPLEDKISISISLGNDDYFQFKDSAILSKLNKVTDLKTSSDMLNYMTKMGWYLVNINTAWNARRSFFFKKEFDKSDFQYTNKS